MNYLKAYCSLIRKAENRDCPEGYVEGHHIFPKSIYGENNRIVKLTAREHYIAHALLEKIFIKRYGEKDYRSIKMIYAFAFMNSHTNQNDYCNSYLYEGCRKRYSKSHSNRMKNYYKHNPSYWEGKKFTDDHIKNISRSLKGRKISKDQIEFLREINTGKKHSEETKQKIREKRSHQIFSDDVIKNRGKKFKDKVWMYDPETEKNYRINKDKVDEKLSFGFILGRCNSITDETRIKLSIAAKKQWKRQRNS